MPEIYKKLKISKNGLPTWDSLIPYILKYIIDNGPTTSLETRVDVADSLGLPETLRNMEYTTESGGNIIENRLAFTISALKISGLIENISRGIYTSTREGILAFNQFGNSIDRKFVENTSSSIEHNRKKEGNVLEEQNISDIEVYDIVEEIEENIKSIKKDTTSDLLNKILESSPYLFEQMVVDLLSKMGYKGRRGSAFVTKKSNDGGIDGVLNLDPLGTQTVYVQAKRYSENNVQRQEIEAFYGALKSINANRGVFITTSKFSKKAIESAEKFSIILINKDDLLKLLIEYEVGIVKDRVFYTYKLDDNFFSQD